MKKNLGILVACTMVTLPSFAYNDILDLVQQNDHHCFVALDGENGYDFGCEPGVYGRLGRGQWAATFDDNKTPVSIIGDSWCSGIQGKDAWTVPAGDVQYAVDAEYAEFYSVGSSSNGNNCYCKMNIPGFSQWVFAGGHNGDCVEYCSVVCATKMANDNPNIMFDRVAGVDRSFTYLYNTKGILEFCFVDNYGQEVVDGMHCLKEGVSGAWQWAAVLDDLYDKENSSKLVTGDAWVTGIGDKDTEKGYPASAAIQDLITAQFTKDRSTMDGDVGYNYCYCRLNTPAESLWVKLMDEGADMSGCAYSCAMVFANYNEDQDPIYRTAANSMFRTLKSVNSGGNGGDTPGGGGSSGGQYEYLYNSRPIGALCGLTPKGGLTGRPKDEDDEKYCKYLKENEIIKELGQWATNYGYSTKSGGDVFDIVGAAWVSSLSPNDANAQGNITYEYELYLTTGNGAEVDGENCYCRIDTPASSEWVLAAQGGIDLTTCTMDYCANEMAKYDGGSGLPRSLFDSIVGGASSSAGIKIPTSKYYVDTNLATRQDAFVGTNNKPILVTYTTTDGQVDGRSIVDSVSSYVSNPDVPERGGVRYALNEKQDVVNGTANWVVTYGNAGGTFNSKPIYNTVNTNYTTALVGAETLNTAVINAVNSEFTPVANVGFLINSVNDIAQLSTQTQPQN